MKNMYIIRFYKLMFFTLYNELKYNKPNKSDIDAAIINGIVISFFNIFVLWDISLLLKLYGISIPQLEGIYFKISIILFFLVHVAIFTLFHNYSKILDEFKNEKDSDIKSRRRVVFSTIVTVVSICFLSVYLLSIK